LWAIAGRPIEEFKLRRGSRLLWQEMTINRMLLQDLACLTLALSETLIVLYFFNNFIFRKSYHYTPAIAAIAARPTPLEN
jgi:hypothetical protein